MEDEGAGGANAGALETAAGSDPSLAGEFALARASEPLALPLVHARLASAMFGAEASPGLGRFRVLERLGAGAMGVVYAAYDPDLDRGVALKLVRVSGDRQRALGEAKALARLSHPHVVPIYDVGIEHDHVYIVMELVRGETMRRWARGRDRRELLDVYHQAGEALAAAHAAGLVHRDFKPDNAIVGRDGRVRVVDFGLARDAADPSTPGEVPSSIAGTPRYMAPEQARGAPASPAADQYSFCVALTEALNEAEQPVPRWLADPLARGRSSEPTARFPSMVELLRALGRDPARVRRRRLALGSVAVLAMAGFVAGRASPGAEVEPCSGATAELAEAWAPGAREAALTRIEGLGPYGRALAPLLREALDDHARRWSVGYRAACMAHRSGAQSAALLDRRMACLERRRAAFATVAEIVGGATAETLSELPLAVRELPDPADCADVGALVADVEPPPPAQAARLAALRNQIESARVQLAAGRIADAHALAVQTSEHARSIGYGPVLAESLLVRGHAAMLLEQRGEAVASLREATELGFSSGASAVAIEAWARRAWMQGMEGEATALGGLEVVEALARRPGASAFARALLHNNLGSVELARSRRAEARAAFERALTESRGLSGVGAVELVVVRSNLALVTDEPARREHLLREVEAELVRLLGAEHPQVLWARLMHARTTLPEPADALALLVPTCEQYERHPGMGAALVQCWGEVGFLRFEIGDAAGAIAATERAAAHIVAWPDDTQLVPYLALWRGDARAAIAGFRDGLAKLATADEAAIMTRMKRGELRLGLGRAERAVGDLGRARTTLQAAIADLESAAATHPQTLLDRRLSRARIELAAIESGR